MTASSGRAVAFTAYECAELVEAPPDPVALGEREVAGRTLASLVSPGTELNWGYRGAAFPSPTGYAAVFEVEAVGGAVTDLTPGDRAFCMGPHRSWQRCARADAVRAPDGLQPSEAVMGRLMCVTMSTLTTTAARPPQVVLVTGLGPVGLLGALIFQSCGYRVVAVDPSPARQALARERGVAEVHAAIPVGDPCLREGPALALECSGHEQAALEAVRAVRRRGEVVLVGVPWRAQTELSAHTLLHAVFHQYAVVRSGWEWEVPTHAQDFRANSILGQIEAAMGWLRSGRIDATGIASPAAPHECGSVYAALAAQQWPSPTAVFDWTRA